MSTLKVHKITNKDDDGAVELTKGAILPAEKVIDDGSGTTAILVNSASGVVTATSFSGDAAGITNLTGTTKEKALGLIFIR
jgi:hypothetical protein